MAAVVCGTVTVESVITSVLNKLDGMFSLEEETTALEPFLDKNV